MNDYVNRIQLMLGKFNIETTIFEPAASVLGTAIIFPGYFGNNRTGPYGLYVRICRALNNIGIRAVTFDYLGTGESSNFKRTILSDLISTQAVIENFKDGVNFYIGHSLACSLVAEACSKHQDSIGISLAPVTSNEIFIANFFTDKEKHGLTNCSFIKRRGVIISEHYLSSAYLLWKTHNINISHIILAGADQYVKDKSFLKSRNHIYNIEAADHNFSVDDTSEQLISILVKIVQTYQLDNKITLSKFKSEALFWFSVKWTFGRLS